MAKKKETTPIVINKTPLVPTTIGSLERKENGPIFTIFLILLFAICIFCLPFISSWLSNNEIPGFSSSGSGNTTTQNPPTIKDEPTAKAEYYEIEEGKTIDFEGYQITSLNVDITTNIFSLRMVRISGSEKEFFTKNYYIELYNNENMLLERFKVPNIQISNYQNLSFNITNPDSTSNIKKMTIVAKDEKDYPQVSLKTAASDTPYLECNKGEEKITYFFAKKDDKYLLKEIHHVLTYQSTNEDYDNLLEEYTTINASLENVDGTSSSLVPIRNGFSYEVTLYLDKIMSNTKSRYFPEPIYYDLNKEARVIAFELGSSGYTCQ